MQIHGYQVCGSLGRRYLLGHHLRTVGPALLRLTWKSGEIVKWFVIPSKSSYSPKPSIFIVANHLANSEVISVPCAPFIDLNPAHLKCPGRCFEFGKCGLLCWSNLGTWDLRRQIWELKV